MIALSVGELGLNCEKCNEFQKIDHGYEKDSPIPGKWKIGDYSFNRCPLVIMDKRANWYITAYNFLKDGILPNDGGWLDQPNKFIEAMNFIESEINKSVKEDGRKQSRNNFNSTRRAIG